MPPAKAAASKTPSKGAAKGGDGASKGGSTTKAKKVAGKSKKATEVAAEAGAGESVATDESPGGNTEDIQQAKPTGDQFLDRLSAAEARDKHLSATKLKQEQGVRVTAAA
mmetsp:Transcript_39841/g.79683  ORF Transcript_39841/g.79683 Transcript_39841/m.79683 type:complete len:110 (-) Transcript_39841:468-797(-)|eukprot:CAMPEP_0174720262 /NCGR_PEP_ID=MMETSP1094-20130205/33155_1 /TAXON_ID=156173 /ORGANISM="Chrysochromulina brevifilum, Strain UTEX LB 985" /LENGTH=109 /DNA_ID=CAMNT_0015920723 /DNA_START=79 /DNA_END=408 /DNA_ORIENTATION=+